MDQGDQRCDVAVIGGGPAGSTAAAWLADAGYSVVLLERQKFPRFHIGESLLPYSVGLFRQMRFADRMQSGEFPVKTGAEFSNVSGEFFRFDFSKQGDGRELTAFQVERADFDQALLAHAADRGVRVIEGARAERVDWSADRAIGCAYRNGGGTASIRAARILDASGRAGLITKQALRTRKVHPRLRNAAIYRHFDGVDEATNPGVPGDIQVGVHSEGWVWAIPVRATKLSVGAVVPADVLRGADSVDELFTRYVDQIPRVCQRLHGARPCGPLQVETNFSYYSDVIAGPGFFVLGDAGCFVDPIFSGGVHLAMSTGIKAAELTAACLSGAITDADAASSYSRFYKTGYDCYFRLALSFYDNKLEQLSSSGEFAPQWEVRLLAGDFWSRENQYASYLRSLSEYAIFEPFEPLFECPVYPGAVA